MNFAGCKYGGAVLVEKKIKQYECSKEGESEIERGMMAMRAEREYKFEGKEVVWCQLQKVLEATKSEKAEGVDKEEAVAIVEEHLKEFSRAWGIQ